MEKRSLCRSVMICSMLDARCYAPGLAGVLVWWVGGWLGGAAGKEGRKADGVGRDDERGFRGKEGEKVGREGGSWGGREGARE